MMLMMFNFEHRRIAVFFMLQIFQRYDLWWGAQAPSSSTGYRPAQDLTCSFSIQQSYYGKCAF